MKKFFKKFKNNRGEGDPIFFVWGMVLVICLLWFSLDLINVNWGRYTIKRESENMARMYALYWVDSIWDPEAFDEGKLQQYDNLADSHLVKEFDRMIKSAMANANLSDFSMMISLNPNTSLDACTTQVLCMTSTDGKNVTVNGMGPEVLKTTLSYGTDLYITVQSKAPYKAAGKVFGKTGAEYTSTMKFASERFGKQGTIGG